LLLGPYNYDVPAPRLWGEAPGVFNSIFLGLDDYEQLKQEVYLLNSRSKESLEENLYDCFNWSIGFRNPKEKDCRIDMFPLYGFERSDFENCSSWSLCCYVDEKGEGMHVQKKMEVETVDGAKDL